MPKYFRKVVLTTAVKFNGKPVPWEKISVDSGVRELYEETDKELIAELERLAAARKMGVTVISVEMYDNLKKNRSSTTSPPPPTVFEKIRVASKDSTLVRPNKPVTPASAAPSADAAPAVPFAAGFRPIGGQTARTAIGNPNPSVPAPMSPPGPPPVPNGPNAQASAAPKKFTPRKGKLAKVQASQAGGTSTSFDAEAAKFATPGKAA